MWGEGARAWSGQFLDFAWRHLGGRVNNLFKWAYFLFLKKTAILAGTLLSYGNYYFPPLGILCFLSYPLSCSFPGHGAGGVFLTRACLGPHPLDRGIPEGGPYIRNTCIPNSCQVKNGLGRGRGGGQIFRKFILTEALPVCHNPAYMFFITLR